MYASDCPALLVESPKLQAFPDFSGVAELLSQPDWSGQWSSVAFSRELASLTNTRVFSSQSHCAGTSRYLASFEIVAFLLLGIESMALIMQASTSTYDFTMLLWSCGGLKLTTIDRFVSRRNGVYRRSVRGGYHPWHRYRSTEALLLVDRGAESGSF